RRVQARRGKRRGIPRPCHVRNRAARHRSLGDADHRPLQRHPHAAVRGRPDPRTLAREVRRGRNFAAGVPAGRYNSWDAAPPPQPLPPRQVPTMPAGAAPSVLNCDCPSQQVLELITRKWTALVITVLAGGTHRYNELQARMRGVSQKVLTETLRSLERDGLV